MPRKSIVQTSKPAFLDNWQGWHHSARVPRKMISSQTVTQDYWGCVSLSCRYESVKRYQSAILSFNNVGFVV